MFSVHRYVYKVYNLNIVVVVVVCLFIGRHGSMEDDIVYSSVSRRTGHYCDIKRYHTSDWLLWAPGGPSVQGDSRDRHMTTSI